MNLFQHCGLKDYTIDYNIKIHDMSDDDTYAVKIALPECKKLIYRKNDPSKLDQRKTWKTQQRENEYIYRYMVMFCGRVRGYLSGNRAKKSMFECGVRNAKVGKEVVIKIQWRGQDYDYVHEYTILSECDYHGTNIKVHDVF